MKVQEANCQSGPWTLYVKRDGRLSPIFCPQFGDQKVEVVPRSEAEALAEALERIALRSDGDVAHHDHAQRLARARVDEYRSRHPKEMPNV